MHAVGQEVEPTRTIYMLGAKGFPSCNFVFTATTENLLAAIQGISRLETGHLARACRQGNGPVGSSSVAHLDTQLVEPSHGRSQGPKKIPEIFWGEKTLIP